MGHSHASFWFAAISIGALIAGFLLAPALAAENGITGYYVNGPNAKLPNGGRPSARVTFPEIKDRNNLRITLNRSGCFGICPIYNVEIHGDGTVIYDGQRFAVFTGRPTNHIPQPAARALFEQFRRADYFWSFDFYRAQVTDLPPSQPPFPMMATANPL